MAVTIYDVAKRAGVGIGTVSRALNDRPNINSETKNRILAIAKELDYTPHSVAQSLASRKTHTIAAIVPFFINYFFVGLLRNIQYGLSAQGYSLLLYSLDRVEDKQLLFEKALSERKCDAILVLSLQVGQEYAEKFRRTRIPVMLIDNYNPLLDSISIANERAAETATRHLIKLGHTHIGLINGDYHSFPAQSRMHGFVKAMQEENLPIDPSFVIHCDAKIGEDGFNEQAGYSSMQQLLAQDKHPTALFVASDVQALGAMRAAKESGLKIPHDIALMGFDDIDFAKYMGLSTMRQPVELMAELAVDRLVKRLQNKTKGLFQVELNAELIVRETCGCKRGFQAQFE